METNFHIPITFDEVYMMVAMPCSHVDTVSSYRLSHSSVAGREKESVWAWIQLDEENTLPLGRAFSAGLFDVQEETQLDAPDVSP